MLIKLIYKTIEFLLTLAAFAFFGGALVAFIAYPLIVVAGGNPDSSFWAWLGFEAGCLIQFYVLTLLGGAVEQLEAAFTKQTVTH